MKLFCPMPQVLELKEQQTIFDSAMRILSQVPLTADGTDEFNEAILRFGCRIDGKKVFFPKPVIAKLMDRIAEYKKSADSKIEELPDRITPFVSGQGSLIADTRNDEIRPATSEDLASLGRIVDALGPDVKWCHPALIPADKPIRSREIHAFATICLNHSKPSRVSPYSCEALKYMYEILKVCAGSDAKARENWFLIAHKIWINTPFMLGRESIEGAMLSRKLLGHKLNFTMMPLAGAATPVTAPGCLALITAEVLAANIVSLAIDDDLALYCSSPLILDFQVGAHVEQDPYADLLRIGANQMRTFIFGGTPHFGAFGPRTGSKIPDQQAMMEKTIGAMFALFCGARSFTSIGTLAYADVSSFVQIMLDLELTSYMNRLLAGLNCDGAERLAEDVNLEIIQQGARFMEHDHTFKFFKQEQWYPMFCDRRSANAWMGDPATMINKARERAIDLEQNAPNKCPLSQSQRDQIQTILAEADAAIKN